MVQGAKVPIIAEVTRLRVFEQRDGLPEQELWLFLRKNDDGEIKYAFSNATEDIPMEKLVRASCMRWSIEQLLQQGKSYLGMGDYEASFYPGWHRHVTLFFCSHFLLLVRLEFWKKLYYTTSSPSIATCVFVREHGYHQENNQESFLSIQKGRGSSCLSPQEKYAGSSVLKRVKR